MEFVAPVPATLAVVITVLAIALIFALFGLFAAKSEPNTKEKLGTFFLIFGMGTFVFGLVGLAVSSFIVDAKFENAYAAAITQTDSRVYLSEDSIIGNKENFVRKQNLIVKETNQVLSCTSVRVGTKVNIACEDPGSNGKMVSVDEALRNA